MLRLLPRARVPLRPRRRARGARSARGHRAAMRFVVDEGPQVRIGRVLSHGEPPDRATRWCRARSRSPRATSYDPEAIAKSQAALLRLGVFRSVAIRVQEPEAPHETKDLAVELAERPWATLAQGVGFSIADGPRAFVEYGEPNILGRALELTARAKVNYPSRRHGSIGRTSPASRRRTGSRGARTSGCACRTLGFLPFPASGRANVIGEILPPQGVRAPPRLGDRRRRRGAHLAAVGLAPVRARGGPHRADGRGRASSRRRTSSGCASTRGSPRCTRSARPSRSTTATTPPTRTPAGSRRARSSTPIRWAPSAPARTTARCSVSSRRAASTRTC